MEMSLVRRSVTASLALASVAFATLAALGDSALAADYPLKPVRIIVGAGPDVVARVLAQVFSEALGHQFVVEQLPGAGGIIAARTVRRARPDGYTLLFSTATIVALQAYRSDTGYNLATDFEPIGKVGEGPAVLFASPSLGAKTLTDVLAIAKAKPGTINCASTGPGTQAHLGCAMLKQYGSADVVHVPYYGVGPALVDLLADRAQLLFGFLNSMTYVTDHKLVAIAVTSKTRSSIASEVPTTAEAGLPALNYTTWYGLDAPKGTPKAITDKLNAVLVKALADPKVQQRILTIGFIAQSSTPEQFGAFVRDEVAKWQKIVMDTGVKPD
jgi:tripartite-type tricarboxylate transporter receptor subunit TctC